MWAAPHFWLHRGRRGAGVGRSVTDDDIDELRGCIDLGFGFDDLDCDGGCASEGDKRLSETFPALDLYYAVHRSSCPAARSLTSSPASSSSSSLVPGCDSPFGSPVSFFSPGDSPEEVKARLRQWAQVVAWSVRHRGS